MSSWGVTEEEIGRVWVHPNADRLELASLAGMDFQFVVRKGEFAAGQKVVYFPVDSMLPRRVLDVLGLVGKLAGSGKDRVRTVRLRGEISQGIVASRESLAPDPSARVPEQREDDKIHWEGCLGVARWEPPEVLVQGGKAYPLPYGLGVYDIESCDRHPDAWRAMLDRPACVTEKLEGTNFAYVLEPDGTARVCSRTQTIEENPGEEHFLWCIVRRQGLADVAEKVATWQAPRARVALRGEVVGPGVQGNRYGLKEHRVFLFDVRVGEAYMDAEDFLRMGQGIPGLSLVPILNDGSFVLCDWLGGRTPKAASNGRSALWDGPREGIVLRPMREVTYPRLGRLILKQRSPEYLAKYDV